MIRHPFVLLLLLVVCASPVGAKQFRSLLIHEDSGAYLARETQTVDNDVAPQAVVPLRDEILWHRYQATIIYSTSISLEAAVFTGAWDGLAMHELAGDGTPLWTVADDLSTTAAATDADVFGSATENAGINGTTIRAWEMGDNRPLWSSNIPNCAVPDGAVKVARDGSILTAAIITAGNFVKLCNYDVATGDKISTYDCAAPSTPRAVAISDDGSLVAVRASTTLYVVETATGALRWSAGIGASADPLAMSGDGNVIASGWTTLRVYVWNGSTYQLEWTNDGGGSSRYLRCCSLSADGSVLVAGWYNISYNQNRLQWYDVASSTPRWTYDAPQAGGGYQELPSRVAVDRTGQYAVLGAWGDEHNTNPEVLVFEERSPAPIFSIDTPGSVFDVAICAGTGGGVYISSCGKNVHANEMGSGGDVYAAEVDIVTAVPDERLASRPAVDVYPNPFNPRTTIRCALSVAGDMRLDIYSADGRLVRKLVEGSYGAGPHDFNWAGLDDAGRPLASGVYLARLRTSSSRSMERMVLLR